MIGSKSINNFIFEIDKNINVYLYFADIEVFYTIDENYGADSDGNRGVKKMFIERIDIIEIRDINNNLMAITLELEEKLHNEVKERFEV